MAERLKVIFLPHPARASMFVPWGEDVIAAVGERHDVRILDYGHPVGPQFQGIDVVVDHSPAGTREMARAAAGTVRLWQILGTGTDHFDLAYWRSLGIPVANCPGIFSAGALAESAMMFVLMLTRRYSVAQENLRRGEFYEPVGRELVGLRLGLIGFGASAKALARRALPFGMRISAIDVRTVSESEVLEYGLEYMGSPPDLDSLVADSDVLSLHLHLNEETHHIIDRRRLRLMKPTALLINVARGALVDEAALTEALAAGRLGGAGLDVYTQEPPDLSAPLFHFPNVITTPHTAGSTDGTSLFRARAVAENIERVSQGLDPLHRVA